RSTTISAGSRAQVRRGVVEMTTPPKSRSSARGAGRTGRGEPGRAAVRPAAAGPLRQGAGCGPRGAVVTSLRPGGDTARGRLLDVAPAALGRGSAGLVNSR